jgi:hypothetical protein
VRNDTGVLAHNQDGNVRASTFVPKDVADELVRRLICERISHKKIRMFPPKSVFLAERPNRPASYDLPEKLPPAEVENCKFIPPKHSPLANMLRGKMGWNWQLEPWPEDLIVSA